MTISVAFIGCGGVARRHHAPAFAKVEGFKIVAACDLDPERARALADDYKVPHFTDAARMLDAGGIDLVDVVTRETHRVQPILQCLAAGKHVYCEKPLTGRAGQHNLAAEDLEDGKRIMDAWRKAGTRFGINFNYRQAAHAKRLKAVIEAGELGEPVAIHVWAHLACWSHVIDLTRWFCGEVDEISAYYTGSANPGPNRCGILKFANGMIGTLCGTPLGSWHHPLLRIEWVGTKGRASITDLCGQMEVLPAEPKEARIWQKPPCEGWRKDFDQTFADSVTAFAVALRDGQEPPVTGLDAFREVEIDAGMAIAAGTGKAHRVEHY